MFKTRPQITLRQSLMLLWLLPLVFICLILGGYLISQRISDTETALFDKQISLLRYLSESSDFAMYANNTTLLQKLTDSVELDKDISGVLFYISNTDSVIHSGTVFNEINLLKEIASTQQQEITTYVNNNKLLFKEISTEPINLEEDFLDIVDINTGKEILGYVFIFISDDYLINKQQDILIRGILFSLFGLVFAILFALYLSQKLNNIFSLTTHSINELKKGNFNTKIKGNYSGETEQLFADINSLADKLHDHNKEMNRNIDSATRQLKNTLTKMEKQNVQLDEAREKAELANQSKDQFLAKMSHELRTPVNAIGGFAQLINKGASRKEDKENSEIILSSSKVLLSIIDELLDYSKIELGKLELAYQPFNLANCIDQVQQMNVALVRGKEVRLINGGMHDPELILIGDEYKLIQILNNLVSNAIKYTHSGSVTLSTEQIGETKTEIIIRISIEDTGIGIKEEDFSKIFKPFSQLNSDINIKNQGAGLGLSIVKRLCDLMGGTVTINSHIDEGTKVDLDIPFKKKVKTEIVDKTNKPAESQHKIILFDETGLTLNNHTIENSFYINNINELRRNSCFDNIAYVINLEQRDCNIYYVNNIIELISKQKNPYLIFLYSEDKKQFFSLVESRTNSKFLRKPIEEETLKATLESSKSDDKLKPYDFSLGKTKILIAEDHDFNRLLLIKLLNQYDCETFEALNGAELLELLPEINPDIVLLDLHMPIINGRQVCKEIRERNDHLSKVPIIMMTADIISLKDEKIEQIGANNIIYKPINSEELLQKISQYSKVSKVVPIESKMIQLPKFNKQELYKEYLSLINLARSALIEKESNNLKKYLHQLKGVAGLSNNLLLIQGLSQITSNSNHKDLWKHFKSLRRLITQALPIEDNYNDQTVNSQGNEQTS